MTEREIQEILRKVYPDKLKTNKDGDSVNSRKTPRGTVRPATPEQIKKVINKSRGE